MRTDLDPSAVAATRDQIVVVLRDSDEPLTSTELGRLVPIATAWPCPSRQGRTCLADGGLPAVLASTTQHVEHLGDVDAVFPTKSAGSFMDPYLRQLEQEGRVTRHKAGHRWHWQVTP